MKAQKIPNSYAFYFRKDARVKLYHIIPNNDRHYETYHIFNSPKRESSCGTRVKFAILAVGLIGGCKGVWGKKFLVCKQIEVNVIKLYQFENQLIV